MNAPPPDVVSLLRSALEHEAARTTVDPGSGLRLESSLRRVRRRQRVMLTTAAALIAILVTVGAGVVARFDTRHRQPNLAHTAIARLATNIPNPSSADMVSAVTQGFGAVWIASNESGATSRLSKADPVTGRIERSSTLATRYVGDLAAGAGAMWVADSEHGQLLQADPRTGLVVGRVSRPGIEGIAVAAGSVWVGSTYSEDVLRIDPISHRVLTRVHVGPAGNHRTLLVDGSSLWVSGQGGLARVDTATGKVLSRLPLPDCCDGERPAVQRGAVWVSDPLHGRLLKIDMTTGRVAAAVPVCAGPRAAITAAANVWVICLDVTSGLVYNPPGGEVVLVDQHRDTVVARVAIRGAVDVAAAQGEGAWVAGHFGVQLVVRAPRP